VAFVQCCTLEPVLLQLRMRCSANVVALPVVASCLIRARNRCERLRFACKPRQPIRLIGEEIGQNLQRDIAIELRVAGPIHLAHPAFADLGGDLVDAAAGAWDEGQTAGSIAVSVARTRLILPDGQG
jgi:hypothetical protein